jgi:type I restriction enzyme S subunit
MRDPRRNPDTPFLYVDISVIDRSLKVITSAPEILGADAPSRARKEIREGDILVSTVRPNLNAVAVVPQHLDGQIASTGFCVLRPNKSAIVGKYLFYFTTTPNFVGILCGKVRGAHYPAVSDSDVKEIELPLPTVSEQRRIVEILDQADALRKKRVEADEKAARILPALFYKMFGDPNENVSKDHFVKISEYAQIIMGQSPPGDTYNNNKDGLPFFQGKMDFGDINPIPRKWCSAPSRIAYQGDILLCVRAPVGPTNLANQKSCIGRGLAAIRPIAGKSISEFLLYSIKAQEKQIAQLGQGSTFSAIRRVDVENIPIPRVNIDKQRIFSKIAREIMDYQLKIRYREKTLETLFSSLLHRAFTGELTAKWREAHIKELLQEMEEQAKALEEIKL